MPAGVEHRIRITLSGTNPPAAAPLLNTAAMGAMAAYTAPSAAGPFKLLECTTGGNPTSGQGANPSMEITGVPPGGKVYIRIWDEAIISSSRNFGLCIQGQIWNGTQQAIADTPCDVVTPLVLGDPHANFWNSFAGTEPFPHDPTCGNFKGGDVWFRTVVPASGRVSLYGELSSVSGARKIKWMGFTLYTSAAGNCSNFPSFREVACVNVALTNPEVALATVNCMVPGEWLWIRAYASADAQNLEPPRFGAFRIRVMNPGGTAPSSTNNYVCTAQTINVGGACPQVALGHNVGACASPIPSPGCGNFGPATMDVWYKFVAPSNGTISIDVNGLSGYNPAAALYTTGTSPCDGPLTLMVCDAKHGVGKGARIIRGDLVPGRTYYLRVWAEEGSPPQGVWEVCLTNPTPPAGQCFYLVRLTTGAATGTQTITVQYNSTTINHVTAGGDPSQIFLIPVPDGAAVHFEYSNNALAGGDGSGYTYAIHQFPSLVPLQTYTGGIAVIGPSPGPNFELDTIACTPLRADFRDCLGASTLCSPVSIPALDTAASHIGSHVDLTPDNWGCLQGERGNGRWFIMRTTQAGSLRLSILAAAEDFNFAIWDAGPITYFPEEPLIGNYMCEPGSPPIRCSNAIGVHSTGLMQGVHDRYAEGYGGFGWLSPIDVVPDNLYLLYVVHRTDRKKAFNIAFNNAPSDLLDCTPMVLPVEYLFIDAVPLDNDVEVTWATATEQNSSHFVVERSTDGINFSPLGRVEAAGDSHSRVDYSFLDHDPVRGANYYRLKQVDRDGAFELSRIVIALFQDRAERLRIHPNPANDEIHLSTDLSQDGTVTILVTDALGRILRTRYTSGTRGLFRDRLPVDMLAPGPYVLQLLGPDGLPLGSVRFMKR